MVPQVIWVEICVLIDRLLFIQSIFEVLYFFIGIGLFRLILFVVTFHDITFGESETLFNFLAPRIEQIFNTTNINKASILAHLLFAHFVQIIKLKVAE